MRLEKRRRSKAKCQQQPRREIYQITKGKVLSSQLSQEHPPKTRQEKVDQIIPEIPLSGRFPPPPPFSAGKPILYHSLVAPSPTTRPILSRGTKSTKRPPPPQLTESSQLCVCVCIYI